MSVRFAYTGTVGKEVAVRIVETEWPEESGWFYSDADPTGKVLADAAGTLRDESAQDRIEAARTQRLGELKVLRNVIQYDAYLYDGHWIDCDESSRANLTGFQLSLVSGTDPFPYQWRSADNAWIPLPDRVTWAALIDAFDVHVKAAWTAFAAHEAAIAVHGDPASHDITTGAWPQTRIDKSAY